MGRLYRSKRSKRRTDFCRNKRQEFNLELTRMNANRAGAEVDRETGEINEKRTFLAATERN